MSNDRARLEALAQQKKLEREAAATAASQEASDASDAQEQAEKAASASRERLYQWALAEVQGFKLSETQQEVQVSKSQHYVLFSINLWTSGATNYQGNVPLITVTVSPQTQEYRITDSDGGTTRVQSFYGAKDKVMQMLADADTEVIKRLVEKVNART